MSAARRDEPKKEEEVSIRERGQELFRSDESPPTTRPFEEYLRETPSTPLPTWVQALLWALAVVVALLFAAALWRTIHRNKAPGRKPSTPGASSAPDFPRVPIAATSPRSNSLACLPFSPHQES
jgi:hypothetical protein